MRSSWRLVVRTMKSDALDLEFVDRALLVKQLAIFRKRGLSDASRLHEFRNGDGALIAFISKTYISHEVHPAHADFL